MAALCSIDGCGGAASTRGLCVKHYTRLRRYGHPLASPRRGRGQDAHTRFWAKVDRSNGPAACWPWLGPIDRYGYARMTFHGQVRGAHRFAVLLHRGPIPDGLEVDHLCRNRRCVNPAHLDVVTHSENIRRGPGSVTHCKNGHEFTAETVRIDSRGRRRCHVCELAYYVEYHKRQKATA